MLGRFDQRLVDITFVELCIAHQRHEPAAIGFFEQSVGGQIILDQAGKGSDRYSQTDRSGGEIDRNPIFGAARIALHPAKAAEIFELLA